VTDYADVPHDVIAELRSICLGLPEAYEEQAWAGTRWRVRKRTFAHVLTIDGQSPPIYARAFAASGPTTVLTFRARGAELGALVGAGYPFYHPGWGRDAVGMVLGDQVDWDEVAELLTESYCVLAPKKLVERARTTRL